MKKKSVKKDNQIEIENVVKRLEESIEVIKSEGFCMLSLVISTKDKKIINQHYAIGATMTDGTLFSTVLEKRVSEIKKEIWDAIDEENE